MYFFVDVETESSLCHLQQQLADFHGEEPGTSIREPSKNVLERDPRRFRHANSDYLSAANFT